MSETYKFMKCQKCEKTFFSLFENIVQNDAEEHMMETGHIVIESNGED